MNLEILLWTVPQRDLPHHLQPQVLPDRRLLCPKFYTGSDHRILRARTTINWDLYTSLIGLWEDAVMDSVDEEYDRFVTPLLSAFGKMPSWTTSMRNTTASCTISTIVLREPRA
ncbi:unnamed protein product [Heligmosomoides polygyrus]|uniref:Uncharacterized protein n=1 Tax=Heligmosomoides polygyrus TaxID=6339 RepID=A0A183GJG6_HELPZ|nr:unnamed protein product [Heligmosomoides polygyrus]